jgi:hypothetical protein
MSIKKEDKMLTLFNLAVLAACVGMFIFLKFKKNASITDGGDDEE